VVCVCVYTHTHTHTHTHRFQPLATHARVVQLLVPGAECSERAWK